MHGRKIGEVAEHTGLSIRTLRHYDELDVVTPSARSQGGFRLYSREDVDQLLLIRRMKPLEFSLDEIREFLRAAALVAAPGSADRAQLSQARETVARVRRETDVRLAKLRKKVAYAEEFLELLGGLTPDDSADTPVPGGGAERP